MAAQNEAVIVLCKCGTHHQTFGIRTERIKSGHWEMNWAFPIKGAAAKREGNDKTTISGAITLAESFPGCPFCGGKSYIVCSNCGHMSCQIMRGAKFQCAWCGIKGVIEGGSGDLQINAGIDA